MLGVIAGRKFEHRFAGAFREPDHGPLDKGRSPVDLLEHPRRFDAREIGRGGEIEVDGHARVTLQERRGDIGGDVAFDCAGNDGGLVLARGDQRDFPRLENRGHTHRDRFARSTTSTIRSATREARSSWAGNTTVRSRSRSRELSMVGKGPRRARASESVRRTVITGAYTLTSMVVPRL